MVEKIRIPAACGHCVFAHKVRADKHDLTGGQWQCMHSPPVPIVMNVPGQGVTVANAYPVVQPHQMCHQFQHDTSKMLPPYDPIKASG